VDTDRSVAVGGGVDHLYASFNATTVAGRIEAGYRYGGWAKDSAVTPYAAFQSQGVFVPAYAETTESGPAGTAQKFNSQDFSATRSELGSWFETRNEWYAGGVLLRGRAAWVHNFDRSASLTETFETLPGSTFVVTGARRAADAALVTGAFEVPIGRNVSFLGKFDGEFAVNATTWAGTGTLRYVW
jgi:outer membrane autotransporter protein